MVDFRKAKSVGGVFSAELKAAVNRSISPLVSHAIYLVFTGRRERSMSLGWHQSQSRCYARSGIEGSACCRCSRVGRAYVARFMDGTGIRLRVPSAQCLGGEFRCRRRNHCHIRCRFIQTSKNNIQPDEAGINIFFGAVGHLQSQPQPDVPGLLFVSGWLGIFFVECAGISFSPCFYRLHESVQIEPEEKALACKFGQEFESYKSRISRCL
jgi:hypothetical protein